MRTLFFNRSMKTTPPNCYFRCHLQRDGGTRIMLALFFFNLCLHWNPAQCTLTARRDQHPSVLSTVPPGGGLYRLPTTLQPSTTRRPLARRAWRQDQKEMGVVGAATWQTCLTWGLREDTLAPPPLRALAIVRRAARRFHGMEENHPSPFHCQRPGRGGRRGVGGSREGNRKGDLLDIKYPSRRSREHGGIALSLSHTHSYACTHKRARLLKYTHTCVYSRLLTESIRAILQSS